MRKCLILVALILFATQASAFGADIDVTVYPGPALPGRLALLAYVHEQSVCITNHRFGHPSPITAQLRL